MNETRWKKIIAMNVRNARLAANMTQQQLADKAKLQVPAISRVESGKHLPNIKTLLLIAESLGVEPSSLLEVGE